MWQLPGASAGFGFLKSEPSGVYRQQALLVAFSLGDLGYSLFNVYCGRFFHSVRGAQDHSEEGFADSMRRIVGAAIAGKPVPPAVLNKVQESRHADLRKCRDKLAAVISDEGNSVWTWYAVNIAAPRLLAERKVDRIVANPPWVKLSGIQERERKRAMEVLGKLLSLQEGGKQSPHLDIAAFFVLHARELYLADPQRDPAVWLVKKSALSAGHWKLFRKQHKGTLTQSVDLERLQPFGGGDARRCCLLMEHREVRADGLGKAPQKGSARLEAHLNPPPLFLGRRRRSHPQMNLGPQFVPELSLDRHPSRCRKRRRTMAQSCSVRAQPSFPTCFSLRKVPLRKLPASA